MRSILVLLTLLLPAVTAAQTVRGRIIERGSGSPIAGAALTLGSRRAITLANGEFFIERAPRGPQTLVVSALGYQRAQLTLYVSGDTTIVVPLDVDPVEIDTLRVEARYVTVRGDVTAENTGIPISYADVRLAGGMNDLANVVGRFKLSRVPAEQPTSLLVRALGYLPLEIAITPSRDTTLHFALKVDPVGQRMIETQLKRLDNRSRGLPHTRRVATRADLERNLGGSLLDYLAFHDFRASPACFFVDDIKREWGTEYLVSFTTNEIARIEMIDRQMLRVYTAECSSGRSCS